MLEITVIAVGEKMPAWVQAGYDEYARRVRGRIALQLREVAAERRGKGVDTDQAMRREAARIRQAVPAGHRLVALDRGGKLLSTLEISRRMDQWLNEGERVALLVGGPEGLDPTLINEAHESWSLSALTFAHPLVRVILAEQVYRCFSILEGLPYHR